jgi:hypothetical protein
MQNTTARLRNATAQVQEILADALDAPTADARDWASFLEALAEFAKVIIPLIAQFFKTKS